MKAKRILAVTLLLALGAWFATRDGTPPAADAAPPPRDSVLTPAPPPAAAVVPMARPVTVATGKLRILTSPPNAEILIDGRRAGVGSVVDLRVPAGAHQLRVQAAGYAPWDTAIVVQAGMTHTLGRVVLRAPTE